MKGDKERQTGTTTHIVSSPPGGPAVQHFLSATSLQSPHIKLSFLHLTTVTVLQLSVHCAGKVDCSIVEIKPVENTFLTRDGQGRNDSV